MAQRSGRIFSYEEALTLFPHVRDRTLEAVREVDGLPLVLAEAADQESADDQPTLDEAFRTIVTRWQEDIERFGCEVKGLWLVDWDSGDGFYCWKHPEPSVAHFHGYDEGFSGRLPLT